MRYKNSQTFKQTNATQLRQYDWFSRTEIIKFSLNHTDLFLSLEEGRQIKDTVFESINNKLELSVTNINETMNNTFE